MAAEILGQEDTFELGLIRQDLISDALFLIGTLISISQNIKAEKEIIGPTENKPSMLNAASPKNVSFGFGPVVLVLFLAGTSVLAAAATERLNKQKAKAANNADQTTAKNINGGEIIILGQLIRIIGYIISISGTRIKDENPV